MSVVVPDMLVASSSWVLLLEAHLDVKRSQLGCERDMLRMKFTHKVAAMLGCLPSHASRGLAGQQDTKLICTT